ncbi:MAG: discoidin domain-containing protein [Spirochaetales bacterium]|nr:discoidin domain-containing protein [Spirochaetales bacterium]
MPVIDKIARVSASSERKNHEAVYVIDADRELRWESDWQDGEWLLFEFSQMVHLSGMEIQWERAAALKYRISVSPDGVKWSKAAEVTDGYEEDIRRINFDRPVDCRYLKVECLERATEWGFSIIRIGFNNRKPYRIRKEKKTAGRRPVESRGRFFTLQEKNGVYWFRSPDGGRFLSRGINSVSNADGAARPDQPSYNVISRYNNIREWAVSTIRRMRKWGFNTVGSWSDIAIHNFNMPFTVLITVPGVHEKKMTDIFNPGFETMIAEACISQLDRYRNARYLLGYFIENELAWYGDFPWYTGHASTLLWEYMKLPAGSCGKKRVIDFFRDLYKGDVNGFNRVWEPGLEDFSGLLDITELHAKQDAVYQDLNRFAGYVAERYFSVIVKQIRECDPNHLILGCRFADNAPDPVFIACGRHCDVISLNCYHPDINLFGRIRKLTNRPILVTEFSLRAMENSSGNRNSKGAKVTVPTQNDRAAGFIKYVSRILGIPYVLGYHWFQYFDQSPSGRFFDGEDSNFGILDIHDREYSPLVRAMKRMNSRAESIHAKCRK